MTMSIAINLTGKKFGVRGFRLTTGYIRILSMYKQTGGLHTNSIGPGAMRPKLTSHCLDLAAN